MLDFIRKVYTKADSIMTWFLKPLKFTQYQINKGEFILILGFIIGGILIKIINNINITTMYGGLFVAYLFFIIMIAFYKCERKGIYKLFIHNTPEKLLMSFTDKAFLYGLFFFIFCFGIFEIIILSSLSALFSQSPYDVMQRLTNHLIEISFINSTLFNILWFGYHIIHETVSIRETKAKMSFYLAISAIISSGVILPIFKELFNITIISITVGFTWVKHLIDLKEIELAKMC